MPYPMEEHSMRQKYILRRQQNRHAAQALLSASVVAVLLAVFCSVWSVTGHAAEPSAPPARPYHVQFGAEIPVRDGTRLSATILRPADQREPLPVILRFTPYGADRYFPKAAFFATRGYVVAIVEVRGRGDSEGVYRPYVNDAKDGYDVVQWLADRDYCDGRVAMRGASYTGFLQWAIAALNPPALKTIVPGAAPYFTVDNPAYRGVEIPYRLRWYALVAGRQRNTNFNSAREFWNGLYAELARGELEYARLDEAAGLPTSYWEKSLQTPESRERYRRMNPTATALAQIDIPVLTMTGAYDGAQLGTFTHYQRLLETNPDAAEHTWLLVGPWDHAGVSSTQREIGGIDFGEAAAVDHLELELDWFDWVLKDGEKPALLQGRVTYFMAGPDEWRSVASLDALPCCRKLVLGDRNSGSGGDYLDGRLIADGGDAEPTIHRFRYDPGLPTVSWGPYFGAAARGDDHLLDDELPLEIGDRGLVYETDPARGPYDVVGNPVLEARIALDVPDTDLIAVLYDVAPDGSTITLAYDFLRARYRDGAIAPDFPEIDRFHDYRFEMTWVARRIPAGHRLRLFVTAPGISHFFQRHTNTDEPVAFADPTDHAVANIRLKADGQSQLLLPVGDGE